MRTGPSSLCVPDDNTRAGTIVLPSADNGNSGMLVLRKCSNCACCAGDSMPGGSVTNFSSNVYIAEMDGASSSQQFVKPTDASQSHHHVSST